MLFGGSWRWDSQDAMLKALMLGWLWRLWFHSHRFYLILSNLSARLPIIDELLLGLWPTGVWASMGLILCLRYVLLAIVGRSLAAHKLSMPQLLWSLLSLLSTGGGLASIVMAIHPCKAFCFAVCVVAAATNRGRTRWEGMRWRLLVAQSRWQFCKTAQKASKMNECVWLDIP